MVETGTRLVKVGLDALPRFADALGGHSEAVEHHDERRRPRVPRRLLWLAVAGLALAWAGAVAATVAAAQGDARSAVRALERARDASTLAPDGPTARHLREASEHVEAARGHLGRPWMAPLRVAPVAGRQLDAIDAMTAAAGTTVHAALDGLERLGDGIEGELRRPETRPVVLARIGEVAGDMHQRLAGIDLGSDEGLIGPVAEARRRFARELDDTVDTLARASAASRTLAAVFEGPHRYLLLAGNNAEMRAGSGMFLMAAELETHEGAMALSQPSSTADLGTEDTVDVDADVARHWGWLSPGSDWRNLAITPRFDVTAEQAARMWEGHTGRRVDGVLALDAVAVEALLSVVGPVDVGGVRFTADNALEELLHEQYVRAASTGGRAERHERLGAVAHAVVERLDDGRWSPRRLAAALADPIAGRHVLAWSRHAQHQTAWEQSGVSGTLSDRSLMVSLLSRSGTKADPFIDVKVDTEIRRSEERFDVTMSATVTNRLPERAPVYVVGPNPEGDLAEGEYVGVLTVHAPAAASTPRFVGDAETLLRGHDGEATVAGAAVRLRRGETARLEARFSLPDDGTPLRVEPSARVPAVEWRAAGTEWRDERPRWIWLRRP